MTLQWQVADFCVVLAFDSWRISSFNSQGWYFLEWRCLLSKLRWQLVSACPYITGQHWLTASQHTGHTESIFSLSPPIGLLTFYSHFSMNKFFSSVQLGINYVCCWEFSLFTTGSGTERHSHIVKAVQLRLQKSEEWALLLDIFLPRAF